MPRLLAILALVCLAMPATDRAGAAEPPPAIAAAASMRFALDELAVLFRQRTGSAVRISYGATGNFVRQIQQGAPFQALFAADEASVAQLAGGHALDGGHVYAVGRLVLVSRKDGGIRLDADLDGLGEGLRSGRITRFAIANPELAPYGAAAREVLMHAGLWDALKDKLVLGENVGQTAQFVSSGGAQAGIIAWSLVQAGAAEPALSSILIPEDRHQPIRHRMVMLSGAGATARAFYDLVRSREGRAVLERHGFGAPELTE